MRSSDGGKPFGRFREAGKGDQQRPVDQKKFNDNWDAIFGKKEPQCPCHDTFIDKWHLHYKVDSDEDTLG